ncbi:uncharacterized protein LOC132746949 [Ruditapes philippinarum]|uniref:uncharacterized protein LOC132746949 n=1 Tax=Ruditapes philippinarum TaxID=129788 RepID=UPI00295BA84C|nr:uncharacterized protein LOC132746949 [Ruditapes philippinarum]
MMRASVALFLFLLTRTVALPAKDGVNKVTQTRPWNATIIKPASQSVLTTVKNDLPPLARVITDTSTSTSKSRIAAISPTNWTIVSPLIAFTDSVDRQQPFEIPYTAASLLKNCEILPEDPEVTSNIKETLNSGSKMIKFHLLIKHKERLFRGYNESSMYKPFYWVRSTGRHGIGLLLLRPEYDVLSLTTLELGVETLHVNITENPSNCLSQLAYTDIEVLFRELVMNDFQNTSSGEIVKLKPTDHVCNMHVTDNEGVADFRFLCCQRSGTNHISCSYLQSDTWLNVLFFVIVLLKAIVVLFSPRLIPDSFYRLKHIAAPYVHRLEKPFTITTVVTTDPNRYTNVKNQFKLSKFREMKNFKTTLQNLTLDIPYELEMNRVHLRVKSGRLLPEDSAPAGLFRTMHESFFKCKIRGRAALADCCNSNFFSFSNCHNKTTSWYTVLKRFMAAVLLIFLATPWIIRMYVYFRYEDAEMHMRKQFAAEKSLRFYFPGNFTLLLTPLHVIFIVIYILLCFESCAFGIMSHKMKEQFKFVLRKCFKDMREMKQMDVIGWLVRIAVKPCAKFGGIGICVGLITWTLTLPVLFLILSFYIFPTVNITLRLLAHFVVYILPKNACNEMKLFARLSKYIDSLEQRLDMDQIAKAESLEKNESVLRSGWKRFQQLIIISLCLLSMYSIIFLVTEFVSFIVEIFVYTLMGLILNASMTLTYFSLAFLIWVYGNDCFGAVSKRFLAFNKTMNAAILELGKKKVENEIYSDDEKQENIAFRVKTERVEKVENPVQLVTNADCVPRWEISRLVLFLSKNNRPMIPKTFYFKSCMMPFYSVPGELVVNYLRAASEFGMILLFLMFVLVVVLAFGDTYEISATNKMLATIAGGFLPFMLRNIVFKSHAVPTVDKDNMHFQICLHRLLDDHKQTWPIYDIDVVNRQILVDSKSENGNGSAVETTDIKTPVFEETNPFIDNGSHRNGKTNNESIDLLINIASEIDIDDFPGMNDVKHGRAYNGSTSLLDDLEPEEKEMREILKNV